jgi:hypothetical protein
LLHQSSPVKLASSASTSSLSSSISSTSTTTSSTTTTPVINAISPIVAQSPTSVPPSTTLLESNNNNTNTNNNNNNESSSDEILLLRKERDVLRSTVKRLQAEQQSLLTLHAAEREQLQERVLSLEYDLVQQRTTLSANSPAGSANNGAASSQFQALQTQYETLLNRCRAYEQQIADWEAWKSKAESIAQDLALRLKEEQKIRRKLDQYLQEQHGVKSSSIPGVITPNGSASTARPHSAGPSTASPAAAGGASTTLTGSDSASVPRLPANEFSISVHHL